MVLKTVKVYSNDPNNPVAELSVRMRIKDQIHLNQYRASEIFSGSCRECHVDRGAGKRGWELFKADCFMCHNAGTNTSLSTMSKLPGIVILRALRGGIENTLMPAWETERGGPLDDSQIESLMDLILVD